MQLNSSSIVDVSLGNSQLMLASAITGANNTQAFENLVSPVFAKQFKSPDFWI